MSFKVTYNGILYDYDKTQTKIEIPEMVDGIKVKLIKADAFRCNNIIEEIIIPETIEELSKQQFYLCTKLKSVVFKGNSKITTIPESCFQESLVDDAVIELPDSITCIGDLAFNHSHLKKIILSKNLRSIGDSAFTRSFISEIDFPKCKKLSIIKDSAFSYCKNLLCLDLSQSKIHEISQGGFLACEKLKTVILPNSITCFRHYCFADCSSLSDVNCKWENVNYIEIRSFSHTNIQKLDLSDFAGDIYGFAFSNSGIKSLILGDYISSIYRTAFKNNPIVKENSKMPFFCNIDNAF